MSDQAIREAVARAIESALDPMIEPGNTVTLWGLAASARDAVFDTFEAAGYTIVPPATGKVT